MGQNLSALKIILSALTLSLMPAMALAHSPLDSLVNSDTLCNKTELLYRKMDLAKAGLSYTPFEQALLGWNKLNQECKLNNNEILAIADLSQSANSKRLYILHLGKDSLLLQTYVAHGKNSGQEYAQAFSNVANSYQSSLGFYTTGTTYQGKHGLSLRLAGMEPSINDFAEQRAIVIHGASYVTEDFIRQNGRLGRSLGCPAVSPEMCQPVIDILKEGSCFFIYYPNEEYIEKSLLCKEKTNQ